MVFRESFIILINSFPRPGKGLNFEVETFFLSLKFILISSSDQKELYKYDEMKGYRLSARFKVP